jgi:hypothetical protein
MRRLSSKTGLVVCPNLRNASLLLAATIALLLSCLPASAQLNTGRISGQVTDQTGGAIAGAKVTVVDIARGDNRELVSDSAGQYAAPNLIPGVYTVRAEFMGFETIERQNVQVEVGSDVRVDITLQPGATTQTVTVTEALPIVNTTNAQTGGTLDNSAIDNLPINGRNFRWVSSFVPGVFNGIGEGSQNTSVNGTAGQGQWNFIVDGLYTETLFTLEPEVGGQSEGGDTTLLPLDAIQEVGVVLNPKAEYGWSPGLTEDVAIKSGTNAIHGSAYAYGRDQDLDARNAFSTVRAPTTFEQYGATLGGPIKKNKIFYFVGFEGEKLTVPSVFQVSDPTLADWTGPAGSCTGLQGGVGATTPGNCADSIPDAIADINNLNAKTPGSGGALNPLSLSLAGCNPSKITPTMTTGAQVLASGACSANQFGSPGLFGNSQSASTTYTVGINGGGFPEYGGSNNGLWKLDYHISDHHSLSGSLITGVYSEYVTPNSSQNFTQQYWEELIGASSEVGRIVEIWTPNSSWLNQARVGVDHGSRPVARGECAGNGLANPSGNNATPGNPVGGVSGPSSYLASYGLYSGAPGCGMVTVGISGFTGKLGFANNRIDWENPIQGADTVSWTRGAHQFKFGVDIRAEDFNGAKVLDSQTGVFTFGTSGFAAFSKATALEDYLDGDLSSSSIRASTNVRHLTQDKVGLFAQDDWRLKSRLVLNLGLRWELLTPMTWANGPQFGNLALGSASGMVQTTQVLPTESEWGPRLGFAWDMTGKGTTVLRSGGGIMTSLPQVMSFLGSGSTTGTPDMGGEPTGSNLYGATGLCVYGSAAGCANPAIGNITSALIVGSAVTSGGIVVPKATTTGDSLPWGLSTVGSLFPLFPNLSPQCGNGLVGTTTGTLDPSPCIGQGFTPNYKNSPYAFWNLNVQHAFTNNLSLDVGYVGSRTWYSPFSYNVNQPAFGINGGSAEELREPFYSATPSTCSGTTVAGSNNCTPGNGYGVSYPWFSTMNLWGNGGGSNYNSLQINLTAHNVHGFTFNGNYTFANGLTQSVVTGLPGILDGNSAFNIHDHLSIAADYAIPGKHVPGQLLEGWAVNTSINVISSIPILFSDTTDDLTGSGLGSPWNLYGPTTPFNKIVGGAGSSLANSGGWCYGVAGSKFAGDGCVQVPDGAGAIGSSTYVSNLPAACQAAAAAAGTSTAPGVTAATDPGGYNGYAQLATIGCYEVGGSAMVPSAQGMYGNMYPGEIRGKGAGLLNASVTKSFRIKERVTTQFRFEIFNLLNRTQYSGVGTNFASPSSFGLASNTPDVSHGNSVVGSGGPREMQLALRFEF